MNNSEILKIWSYNTTTYKKSFMLLYAPVFNKLFYVTHFTVIVFDGC